ISAFRHAGIPVALKDLSALSPNRSDDPTLMQFDTRHPYGVNLVCVNADQHFVVMSHVGEQFFRGRYNIGVWFWELPTFPEEWLDRFAHYDEIWVASSFVANTLAPISPIPVVRIPSVLTGAASGSRDKGRAKLNVVDDEFVFLFIFDFRSYFERKNPIALINAFKRAFTPDEPVRLVIKCVNEDFEPHAAREMARQARGHPISIEHGYWTADDIRDLMAAGDAYVSLHRAEGLGLPLADAMVLGKPVIATAWSGNMDFMDAFNSFPVKYRLVELEEDIGPYRAGSIWAEPSVEHAAELMRLVYSRTPEVEARTVAARADIEAHFSVNAVAEVISARLAAIAQRPPPDVHPSLAAEPNAAMVIGPRYRRAPIVPPMDLKSSIYGWPGRLLKRGVVFLLSYFLQYQQQVNLNFSTFMRDLEVGQDAQSERIDQLSAQIESMEESVEAVRLELARAGDALAERTHQTERSRR
ncbi:MAG: glycosyltransferase, partial [Chloroflexi bacterium]|nr:glycosyltransferase [Chloroflexota bacterium]